MDLREAIGRSTVHALPHALKSRKTHVRAFWLSVFLIANLVLGFHLYHLLNRFLNREVSTTIRTKLNDTILLPIIYVILFDPKKIVSDIPYEVSYQIDAILITNLKSELIIFDLYKI